MTENETFEGYVLNVRWTSKPWIWRLILRMLGRKKYYCEHEWLVQKYTKEIKGKGRYYRDQRCSYNFCPKCGSSSDDKVLTTSEWKVRSSFYGY